MHYKEKCFRQQLGDLYKKSVTSGGSRTLCWAEPRALAKICHARPDLSNGLRLATFSQGR